MKRIGNLFDAITDGHRLTTAAWRAACGRRKMPVLRNREFGTGFNYPHIQALAAESARQANYTFSIFKS